MADSSPGRFSFPTLDGGTRLGDEVGSLVTFRKSFFRGPVTWVTPSTSGAKTFNF